MPLTPQITITANLQQITGAVDAAKVTFELANYGNTIPRVSGTCVIVQTSTTATADGSGNISVVLWGNDVVTPSGTEYTAKFYNDAGGLLQQVAYQFTGSGSFDLSNVVPLGQTVTSPPQPNSATPQVFTPVAHEFLTGMNSVGQFSAAQPAFSDLSGTASTAQIPNLAASTITSGTVALARGGTNADLSATGGAHQVLKQSSVGAAITVGQLAAADLSDTATTGNVLRGNGTSFVSAALAAADLSNGITGSGAVALATSSTLTTPNIGAATATSINKVAITAPATGATLTIANNKTLTANNSIAIAGTDGTTLTGPASPPTGGVLSYGGPKQQIFTGSGTFTIPTGVTAVKATVIAAGGAGGGAQAAIGAAGTGGGAGGCGIKWLSGLTPGNTITVTVGTGGTGVANGTGNAGTASSISSGTQTITTVSTNAGGGGGANNNVQAGAAAAGTGGDLNFGGGQGGWGNSNNVGGPGSNSIFGGGGGGGLAGAGGAANAPGAGGGGAGGNSGSTQPGGAGANGIVIFEWAS